MVVKKENVTMKHHVLDEFMKSRPWQESVELTIRIITCIAFKATSGT